MNSIFFIFKWLDLKNNPLNPQLKQVAGDCLDEKDCKKCAQSVIKYMKQLSSDEERKKQEIFKQKRELELKNKLKEEEERKKLKETKRLEKLEKKRQEIEMKTKLTSKQENTDDVSNASSKDQANRKSKKNKQFANCLRFTLIFVFISTLTFFLFIVCCEKFFSISSSYIDTNGLQSICYTYSIDDISFLKRLLS
jgi:hypothetical protein